MKTFQKSPAAKSYADILAELEKTPGYGQPGYTRRSLIRRCALLFRVWTHPDDPNFLEARVKHGAKWLGDAIYWRNQEREMKEFQEAMERPATI